MIYSHADMVEAESSRVFGGNAVIWSSRSPAKNTPNEDSAAVLPWNNRAGLLIVADGVGGYSGGDIASRLVIQSIADTMHVASNEGRTLRTAVIDGIEAGNQQILDLGIGAATTLVVVEVQGNECRTYHVGDSVMVVISRSGRIKWQTVPHSPVGFAVEAGVLDEEDAMHHEDRHLVSNVVGTEEMRIEVGPSFEVTPRNTVLVATDGLFDNLRMEEIGGYFRKGRLAKCVTSMAGDCRERMLHSMEGQPSKPDDTTVIAFRPSASTQNKFVAANATIARSSK